MPPRASAWDRWLVLLLLLVAAGALALRLPQLDRRPMHNDEAVNAVLLHGLWERGVYRYNPDEYHGPSLHYASLPFLWLSGTPDFDHLSERTLRWVAVAAGVALVLGVGLLRGALGNTATLAAAILLALSPAMVFYSRYFIHEMLLVFSTLLLLAGAWRYLETGKPVWAAVAGTSLGLMHATKETFVITLAAMGLAVAATLAWNRWRPLSQTRTNPAWNPRHLALALGVAAAVSLILFTSFFTHLRGPLDSLLTYLPWLQRAGGHSPHIHPWYAYFERLLWFQSARGPVWSEAWIAVLALIGLGAALTGRGLPHSCIGFARFLAFYTILITAAYCAIPYKTPWCLLNFWMPAILLAGLGTAALLGWARRGPLAWTVGLIWFAGSAHLGWQAWQCSHPLTNHRGNPYIYAQTVPNVLELSDRVKAIAAAGPQGMETSIRVVAAESEYWPLPWYLRQLRNVGWLDQLPEEPYPPILVVGAGLKAALDEKTQKRWLSVGYYELRPREFFELFVEFELWKRFVATLPRPKDDE
jgi:uncharacterized protein (TIGR03663 family)